MSKVVAIMSMSFDGFVADVNDGVAVVLIPGNPSVIAGVGVLHLRYPVNKT